MYEDLLMTMSEFMTVTNTALGQSSVPRGAGHGDHFCTESSAGTYPLPPPSTSTSRARHGDQAILSMDQ